MKQTYPFEMEIKTPFFRVSKIIVQAKGHRQAKNKILAKWQKEGRSGFNKILSVKKLDDENPQITMF